MMLKNRESSALLRLGVPIVIGQLGIIIVSFIDTMMVGWYGTQELGAAGFVNNRVKIEIGLCKGKKLFDKKNTLKEKDISREAERQLRV